MTHSPIVLKSTMGHIAWVSLNAECLPYLAAINNRHLLPRIRILGLDLKAELLKLVVSWT